MALNYDIVVNYITKGSPNASLGGMSQRIGQTQKAWEKLHQSQAKASQKMGSKLLGAEIEGLGGIMSTAFGGAATAVGSLVSSLQMATVGLAAVAAGGLGAGLIKGIGINQELQDLKISLAATFQANYGIDPFTTALSQADGMMKKLRKDAALLPGTLTDLAGIFKSIAPVSGNLGLTPQQTEMLAAKSMAAGKVSGLSGPVIGREMSLILSGNAHANNVLSTRLGLDSKKMNQMSGTDRVAELTRVLAKYDSAIDAFGKSFSGVSTTFGDNLKLVLAAGTAAPFQRITSLLGQINDWFTANNNTLLEGVENWGARFVGYIDIAMGKLAKFQSPLFEMLRGADPGKMGAAASMGAQVLGAASIAKIVAPMITSWAGGIGSAAGAAGTAIGGPGLGKLAELGGDIQGGVISTVLMTAAVATLAGAVHSLFDTTSYFHEYSVNAFKNIYSQGAHMFDELLIVFGNVTPIIWNAADALGSGFLTAVSNVMNVLEPVTSMMASFTDELSRLWYELQPMMNGLVGKNARGELLGANGGYNEAAQAPKVINHNTTVNGGIHMHIESKSEDPNRIARLVLDNAKRVLETPTKSVKSGQWSGAGRPTGSVEGRSGFLGGSPENIGR